MIIDVEVQKTTTFWFFIGIKNGIGKHRIEGGFFVIFLRDF